MPVGKAEDRQGRRSVVLLDVFPAGPGGGNPTSIVADARGMTGADMLAMARDLGHESGFVFPLEQGYRFRFFVPRHEMEMCGHATVGALWLLHDAGSIGAGSVHIETLAGPVTGHVGEDGTVRVSQPAGAVEELTDEAVRRAVCEVLRVEAAALRPLPMLNATTSRTKTLIALSSADVLHGLEPDFGRIEELCESIGSTGLYPFAPGREAATFHARQFPKAAGYPEDAATGIAATALAFGTRCLGLVDEAGIVVRQGEALGRPSEIHVRFAEADAAPHVGCWLSGSVHREESS
jgi:PhzF family phenazine biosynthesis protein